MPKNLGTFSESHIDRDLTGVRFSGSHEGALFYNCKFKDVRGAVFKECKLGHSSFGADSLEELLGLTVTLDCGTFANVQLSELVFDAMLMLLIKSKGNVEKRRKLIDLLGEDRVKDLLLQMKDLE